MIENSNCCLHPHVSVSKTQKESNVDVLLRRLLEPTVLSRTDFPAAIFFFFFFFVFSEDEKAKREVPSWTLEGDVNTNPWSGYRYTGKLRPHYPLVSNRCHSVLQHCYFLWQLMEQT